MLWVKEGKDHVSRVLKNFVFCFKLAKGLSWSYAWSRQARLLYKENERYVTT